MGPSPGSAESDLELLLRHIDGSAHASTHRSAARGVVDLLRRRALQHPTRALRRVLVGVPCAVVDEVAGAAASLAASGAFDADALVGELIAALAACAAASSAFPSLALDRDASAWAPASSSTSDAPALAAALVRGVALVAFASKRDPSSASDARWAGPAHPLARCLRAAPALAAPAVAAAVAAALGRGPDSASALAGVPPDLAFDRLRPFLRHALLADDSPSGERGGAARSPDASSPSGAFSSAAHATLVRVAHAPGPVARAAAALLVECLPWYRASRSRWVAETAASDVADALDAAFFNELNSVEVAGGLSETTSRAPTGLERRGRRLASRAARHLVSRLARRGSEWSSSPASDLAALGAVRRLLERAGARGRDPGLACDAAATASEAARRSARGAEAIAAILAATRVDRSSNAWSAIAAARAEVLAATLPPRRRGGRLAARLATPPEPALVYGEKKERGPDAAPPTSEKENVFVSGGYVTLESAAADALAPLWRDFEGHAEAEAEAEATLLAALAAEGAAEDEAARRSGATASSSSRGGPFDPAPAPAPAPDPDPPWFSLALCTHPSPRVRRAASAAFAARVVAAPARAPAAVAALTRRLARSGAYFLGDGERKEPKRQKPDSGRERGRARYASASARLAALRAVCAGAAHPLAAPAAVRALAPLARAPPGGSGCSSPRAKTNAAALSLALLAEAWVHRRALFPRLKAAAERHGESRVPASVVAAASAALTAARHSPLEATALAKVLRDCMEPSAPAPATALALEAVAEMCDADALAFFPAFKVVAKRVGRACPDDPLVGAKWAGLLGRGARDAARAPELARLAVEAAWEATKRGRLVVRDDDAEDAEDDAASFAEAKRWEATRAAAFASLGAFDPVLVVGPADAPTSASDPASPSDEDPSSPPPAEASALAAAYLSEPVSFGVAERAARATVTRVARAEAAARFAPDRNRRVRRARAANDALDGASFSLAEAVDAELGSDPLLRRVARAAPKRLARIGGGDSRALAPGARLLLFRPTSDGDAGSEGKPETEGVPRARGNDEKDPRGGKPSPEKRRASALAARRRDRAGQYRRAFETAAAELRPAPPGWWWRTGLLARSFARFAARWLDAETDARAPVTNDGAAADASVGAPWVADARREARASVFASAAAVLGRRGGDAGGEDYFGEDFFGEDYFGEDFVGRRAVAGPEACACASLALAAPALVRAKTGAEDGATDASGLVDGAAEHAAAATDALLVALGVDPGRPDGSIGPAIDSRGACAALACAAAACPASDRARREAALEALSRRATDREGRFGAAAAGAAAEALGVFARATGRAIRTRGPGAPGSWRAHLLTRANRTLEELARSAREEGPGPGPGPGPGGFFSGAGKWGADDASPFLAGLDAGLAHAADAGASPDLSLSSGRERDRATREEKGVDARDAILATFVETLEKWVQKSSAGAAGDGAGDCDDRDERDERDERTDEYDASSSFVVSSAAGAAAALPAAAASSLAADRPADATCLRALAALVAGARAGLGARTGGLGATGEKSGPLGSSSGPLGSSSGPLGSSSYASSPPSASKAVESAVAACCASAGALLHVALSAGVAVPRAAAEEAADVLAARVEERPGDASLGSAATQAAAAAGLAAMLGGSWCLAGASSRRAFEFDPVAGGAASLAGVGGSDSAFVAAPLLWSHRHGGGGGGAGPGTRAVKRCVAALEAAAGLGGGGASTRRADLDPRARDVAAWGLALAADAAVAEAAARAKGGGGAAGAGGSTPGPGFLSSPSAEPNASAPSVSARVRSTGAVGALAEAALGFRGASDDARGSEEANRKARRSARRALVALAGVERLPPGDWAGALRRLARSEGAPREEERGGGGENRTRGSAVEEAAALRDARIAFAVAHPGPGAGAATLEAALALGDEDDASASGDDVDAAARSPPPPPPPLAVLRALPRCVAALPRADAGAALLRACERVAANLPDLPEGSSSKIKGASYEGSPSYDAMWSALADPAGRAPRGPWSESEVAAAAATLAGAAWVAKAPGGPDATRAVEGIEALSRGQRSDDEEAKRRGLALARRCALAADAASARHGAISHPSPLRARLAARGAIDASDVPPLDAWRPRANLSATLRVLAPALARDDRAPDALKARWLEEAARGSGVQDDFGGDARIVGGDASSGDDSALAPLAALASAWAPGPVGALARARAASRRGAPELGGCSAEDAADARALPATLAAVLDAVGRGANKTRTVDAVVRRAAREAGAHYARRGEGGKGAGAGIVEGDEEGNEDGKRNLSEDIFLDASPAGLAASAVRDAASRETWAEHAWRL